MKTVLTALKMHITVFVMIMVLIRMKYEWMGIGFIRLHMLFLTMGECQKKGFHLTTLCDGQQTKVLQEALLKKFVNLHEHVYFSS